MKFSTVFIAAVAFFVANVIESAPIKRDVPSDLIPEFGVSAGVNPDGTGNCEGIVVNGQPAKIPCSCPPDRQTFIDDLNANVAAGHAVNNPSISLSFPTDNSKASQLARLNAATITLQNLHGPGVGCPQVATTRLLWNRYFIKTQTRKPVPLNIISSLIFLGIGTVGLRVPCRDRRFSWCMSHPNPLNLHPVGPPSKSSIA
ncbi:hypothetical protein ABKN59_006632 [Abortiporus biennis]